MMSKTILAAMTIALALGQSPLAHAQLPHGVFPGEHSYKLASAGALCG